MNASAGLPPALSFLDAASIVPDLDATSLEDAIARLTDRVADRLGLPNTVRAHLLSTALAREAEASTCLGAGLAVPHGELPEGLPLAGALGLMRRGLPAAPGDEEPVRCVFLLATPTDRRDEHLQALAAIARHVGRNPELREALAAAQDGGVAHQLLSTRPGAVS